MIASRHIYSDFAIRNSDRLNFKFTYPTEKQLKMLAIEDFPEYHVPGAKQVQFNPYESNGG